MWETKKMWRKKIQKIQNFQVNERNGVAYAEGTRVSAEADLYLGATPTVAFGLD
jgi:hypothetical protein